jgi:hypothetical protein
VTPQQRIEATFRKLPVCRAGKPGAPHYEETIPSIARELALMRPATTPTALGDATGEELAKLAEQAKGMDALKRHDEAASSGAARKELAELKKRAEGLLDAIGALHRPAIDALGYRAGALIGAGGLTTRLRILIASASSAAIPGQPPNRGAKVKAGPRKIALAVAEHYYRLTGDKPTVDTRQIDTDYDKGSESYGPFLDLLTEVFAALGVKASPESQAKIASGAFKAKYR